MKTKIIHTIIAILILGMGNAAGQNDEIIMSARQECFGEKPVITATWTAPSSGNLVVMNSSNGATVAELIIDAGEFSLEFELKPEMFAYGVPQNYTADFTVNGASLGFGTVRSTFRETQEIKATYTLHPGECDDDEGTITVNITGGNPPFDISLANQGTILVNTTGPWSWPTEPITKSNTPYEITIKSQGGACPDDFTDYVLLPDIRIEVKPEVENADCFGDDGSIFIPNSPEYAPLTIRYSNNENPGTTTQLTIGTPVQLPAGEYTLHITQALPGGGTCYYTLPVEPITQPSSAPKASVQDPLPVLCFGASDGFFSITAWDGTPGYTFSNSGPGRPADAIGSGYYQVQFEGLSANVEYTIKGKDGNGCDVMFDGVSSKTVTLTQTDEVNFSAEQGDMVDCPGDKNATIILTAISHLGNIEYSLTGNPPFNVVSPITGLGEGTYTITGRLIAPLPNCSTTRTVPIADAPSITLTPGTPVSPTCVGDEDGSITLAASGRAGASFIFELLQQETEPTVDEWNSPIATSSTGAFTGILSAGRYWARARYTVEPFCTPGVESFVVVDPDQIAFTATPVDAQLDCAGDVTNIIINPLEPNLTFTWAKEGEAPTPVPADYIIREQGVGTYIITATNTSSCTHDETVTIKDKNPIEVENITNPAIPDPLCPGATSVNLVVRATQDGVAMTNVQFKLLGQDLSVIRPLQESGTFSDLAPATYKVVAEENGTGCEGNLDITINRLENIEFELIYSGSPVDGVVQLPCANKEAEITINITKPATGPFEYKAYKLGTSVFWDDFTGSFTIPGDGSQEGNYVVEIRYKGQCDDDPWWYFEFEEFELKFDPNAGIELASTENTCAEWQAGTLTVSPKSATVFDATTTFDLEFSATGADGTFGPYPSTHPKTGNSVGGYILVPNGDGTLTYDGLIGGYYRITANIDGCIFVAIKDIFEPDALDFDNIVIQPCNVTQGGEITVIPKGGRPDASGNYSIRLFTWVTQNGGHIRPIDPPINNATYTASSYKFTDLQPVIINSHDNIYRVLIEDAYGCALLNAEVPKDVEFKYPDPLEISRASLNHVLCDNANTGSASATAKGGIGGYTYEWYLWDGAPGEIVEDPTLPVDPRWVEVASFATGATTSASSLYAGTYMVVVRDGCSEPDIEIIEVEDRSLRFLEHFPVVSYVDCDVEGIPRGGSLEIKVTGGVPRVGAASLYNYRIIRNGTEIDLSTSTLDIRYSTESNGEVDVLVIYGLAVGDEFEVYVTDAASPQCAIEKTTDLIIVSETVKVNVTQEAIKVDCFNEDGKIEVIIEDGAPGYRMWIEDEDGNLIDFFGEAGNSLPLNEEQQHVIGTPGSHKFRVSTESIPEDRFLVDGTPAEQRTFTVFVNDASVCDPIENNVTFENNERFEVEVIRAGTTNDPDYGPINFCTPSGQETLILFWKGRTPSPMVDDLQRLVNGSWEPIPNPSPTAYTIYASNHGQYRVAISYNLHRCEIYSNTVELVLYEPLDLTDLAIDYDDARCDDEFSGAIHLNGIDGGKKDNDDSEYRYQVFDIYGSEVGSEGIITKGNPVIEGFQAGIDYYIMVALNVPEDICPNISKDGQRVPDAGYVKIPIADNPIVGDDDEWWREELFPDPVCFSPEAVGDLIFEIPGWWDDGELEFTLMPFSSTWKFTGLEPPHREADLYFREEGYILDIFHPETGCPREIKIPFAHSLPRAYITNVAYEPDCSAPQEEGKIDAFGYFVFDVEFLPGKEPGGSGLVFGPSVTVLYSIDNAATNVPLTNITDVDAEPHIEFTQDDSNPEKITRKYKVDLNAMGVELSNINETKIEIFVEILDSRYAPCQARHTELLTLPSEELDWVADAGIEQALPDGWLCDTEDKGLEEDFMTVTFNFKGGWGGTKGYGDNYEITLEKKDENGDFQAYPVDIDIVFDEGIYTAVAGLPDGEYTVTIDDKYGCATIDDEFIVHKPVLHDPIDFYEIFDFAAHVEHPYCVSELGSIKLEAYFPESEYIFVWYKDGELLYDGESDPDENFSDIEVEIKIEGNSEYSVTVSSKNHEGSCDPLERTYTFNMHLQREIIIENIELDIDFDKVEMYGDVLFQIRIIDRNEWNVDQNPSQEVYDNFEIILSYTNVDGDLVEITEGSSDEPSLVRSPDYDETGGEYVLDEFDAPVLDEWGIPVYTPREIIIYFRIEDVNGKDINIDETTGEGIFDAVMKFDPADSCTDEQELPVPFPQVTPVFLEIAENITGRGQCGRPLNHSFRLYYDRDFTIPVDENFEDYDDALDNYYIYLMRERIPADDDCLVCEDAECNDCDECVECVDDDGNTIYDDDGNALICCFYDINFPDDGGMLEQRLINSTYTAIVIKRGYDDEGNYFEYDLVNEPFTPNWKEPIPSGEEFVDPDGYNVINNMHPWCEGKNQYGGDLAPAGVITMPEGTFTYEWLHYNRDQFGNLPDEAKKAEQTGLAAGVYEVIVTNDEHKVCYDIVEIKLENRFSMEFNLHTDGGRNTHPGNLYCPGDDDPIVLRTDMMFVDLHVDDDDPDKNIYFGINLIAPNNGLDDYVIDNDYVISYFQASWRKPDDNSFESEVVGFNGDYTDFPLTPEPTPRQVMQIYASFEVRNQNLDFHESLFAVCEFSKSLEIVVLDRPEFKDLYREFRIPGTLPDGIVEADMRAMKTDPPSNIPREFTSSELNQAMSNVDSYKWEVVGLTGVARGNIEALLPTGNRPFPVNNLPTPEDPYSLRLTVYGKKPDTYGDILTYFGDLDAEDEIVWREEDFPGCANTYNIDIRRSIGLVIPNAFAPIIGERRTELGLFTTEDEVWTFPNIHEYSNEFLIEVSVMNRAGILVFEHEDYNAEVFWRGTMRNGNTPVPVGTYYYIVNLVPRTVGQWQPESIKGTVTIIR